MLYRKQTIMKEKVPMETTRGLLFFYYMTNAQAVGECYVTQSQQAKIESSKIWILNFTPKTLKHSFCQFIDIKLWVSLLQVSIMLFSNYCNKLGSARAINLRKDG